MNMTIRFSNGKLVAIICVCACILICPQIWAADYDFTVSQSHEFPATGEILMYQIYDMDGDGLAEILALFPRSYYIYSPLYDSILFSDTMASSWFSGLLPTDYDDDGTTDILILEGWTLCVQDGAFDTERQALVDLRYTFSYLSEEPRAANMFLGDADLDGNDELIVGRLGFYYRYGKLSTHVGLYPRGKQGRRSVRGFARMGEEFSGQGCKWRARLLCRY